MSNPEAQPSILGFSDIDGTISPGFSWLPICDELVELKYVEPDENKRIYELRDRFEDNEIDYHNFIDESFKLVARALKGKKASIVKSITAEFVSTELPVYGWVAPTFEYIQDRNGQLTLISAAPGFIVEAMSKKLGIQNFYSTVLDRDSQGFFTGAVGMVLDARQKGFVVAHEKNKFDEPPVTYVFGDTTGDYAMLNEATGHQRAFCINPDPRLRELALLEGMTIVDEPQIPACLIID